MANPQVPGQTVWFGPDGGPYVVTSSFNPLPVIASAGTGTFTTAGVTGDGSALSGNPVRVGGSDGTNIRTFSTDTSGHLQIAGAAGSGASAAGNPVAIGAIFTQQASLPAVSTGQAVSLQADAAGTLKTGTVPLGAAVSAGANVAASANNQTLAGASNKTTYLSGFAVTGLAATSAASITITTTGLANNLSFVLPIPAGVTVGVTPLIVTFNPPLPASATNTAIVVQVPSFGSGNTTASASAWGFQL